MKRLLLCLLAVLCLSAPVFGQYVKVLGVAQQSQSVVTSGISSTTKAPRVFPLSTITIWNAGTTTPASIFSNATGTVKANPYTADSFGVYDFFIAPGATFDVRVSGTGVTTPFTRSGYTAPGQSGQTLVACAGTNDTTLLTAANTTGGTIVISKGVTCAANSLTITASLNIQNGGLLKPLTGQTVRILGYPDIGIYQAFTNATVGLGTIAFNTAGLVDNHNLGLAIYPEWWGAIADNATDNALTLQAAQTALTTVQNGVLWFSTGFYLTSVAIQITEVKGITWKGTGREVTRVRATAGAPAIQCNGIWRSRFEGMQFDTSVQITGNRAVFELDGNYDSIHTQGVQGNTFIDCYFNANQLADYAFAICRQGSGNGQGSENLFLNNNFDGATAACFYSNGFNALQNTIIGGNFQSYPKDGVLLNAGSINIFSVGFQSTFNYTQVANNGFDIHVGAAGTGEPIVVIGCRSESYQFFGGTNVQPGVLIGNYAISGGSAWVANTSLALNYSVMKMVLVNGITITQLYRVTTSGTSGAVEPTWPASGTVVDGTITWTKTNFKNVDGTLSGSPGLMTMLGNNFLNGTPGTWRDQVVIPQTITATDPFYVFQNITWDYDVSGGSITRSLAAAPTIGQIITVIKTETSANTVTVSGNGKLINGSATQIIPGGSIGWLSVQYTGTAWRILSKSFGANTVEGYPLVEAKLATITSVDMNTATATTLFTVPTGKSCIITKIVVRTASTSLTTASYSFGFNSASFNDVIANATHTELTGSTLYTVLSPKVGAKVGAAADVLKVLNNTLQGGAATTNMDVYGVLF